MVKTINTIDLVTKAQDGCEYAMERLAAEVCDRVYPILLKMTRDATLADDLMQEVLLVLLRKLKNLEQVEWFWGWIITIARRQVYDHLRKKCHREVTGSMNLDSLSSGDNHSVFKKVAYQEMKDRLAEEIGKLKHQHRKVVQLRHFEHKSYTQIALATDCTPQQARIRYFRAKRSLQKRFCRAGYGIDG